MSTSLDRLARVCPPRMGATFGAGAARAVACNVATAAIRLDNDLFQYPAVAGAVANPGEYGRAIVSFHAETNDLYVNFGTSTVVANSAAVSGNTVSARIPAGQEREYEIDPKVDLYCSARTLNGGALVATLRYRITSFPTQGLPGSG